MQLRLMTLVVTTLALVACSTSVGTTDTPTGGNSTSIELGDNMGQGYFYPSLDSLTAGSNGTVVVTFVWASPQECHNVWWDTGPAPLPDSLSKYCSNGLQRDVALPVGTYTFHCTIHMDQGTIVVKPQSSM